MQQIISGGTIAFIITFLVIPVIIVIAKKKKLYDEPDDKRKFHKRPIPSLGGLGIFVGFILSILLTLNFSDAPEFQFYIAGFLLLFFLGIKDDIMVLSAHKKFLGQILVAGILIYKANLVINNMHGLLGLYEINTLSSYLLTVFAIVVIINAFNLIDGVDGLAGGIGLISSLVFGIFFLINRDIPYAVLAFTFSGSLMAFLYYNFFPARIFMGDTGSLMVGLMSSILVIKFIQSGSTYTLYPVSAAPAVGFGILLLPLMDTLRVFLIRVIQGRSPFSPDRNHIHHLFLSKGFNHKSTTLICVVSTVLISVIAFTFQKLNINLLVGILITMFVSLVYFISYKKSSYGLRVVKGDMSSITTDGDVKLVPLFEAKGAVVDEE